MMNQNQNQNAAAEFEEQPPQEQEQQQEQEQEQEQEQNNFHDTCVASYLHRCSDDLQVYDVVYHCRPREKSLARGHGPYDDMLQVGICSYHHNKLISRFPSEEERCLPQI